MEHWVLGYESSIRLSFFLGLFVIMAVLEAQFPRRQLAHKPMRSGRWLHNISLSFLASVLTRIILPISLVSFAIDCQASGMGLFNLAFFDDTSGLLLFVISLVLFDLIIYWQHRIFHFVPVLWRLHKVHHSDQHFDVSTGIRFHPLEILASIAIKFAVVFIFGLSAESIIAFEVMLNGLALFNHSNVKIPLSIDRHLRKFIVTPDMHRVHHSQIPSETDSNFGFNISLWDHLFGSYQGQPKLGHEGIEIGLREFNKGRKPLQFFKLLMMPFHSSQK